MNILFKYRIICSDIGSEQIKEYFVEIKEYVVQIRLTKHGPLQDHLRKKMAGKFYKISNPKNSQTNRK